ncbi:hypothetical protein RIR_jg425.t1 [Rhizophagus irregularis DAOM 181602=DAOM 197198]|nr:hypothetical protein RIR_jg425.t1 [Rhizophagus irregularis DAOM 181602=DAOM 197198]
MECFKISLIINNKSLLQKQQEIIDKDVNEKENEIKCFNPGVVRHGRLPNRYLSEGEIGKESEVIIICIHIQI